ncbi:14751_t:CDS:10, partial [Funneliformis mosseae]
NFEQFNYPKNFMNELIALYKSESCMYRIKECIFDHYFHIKYTEGIQVMQFNFRISYFKNKQMIAFFSGYGNIALYLIENGLEIIRKDLGKDTKIIGCEFKDDNKLMIIKQDKIPGKNLVVTKSDEIISIYDRILKIDNKTKENQSFLPELELYKDEPWITDDYKKKWIYLDQEESIQLYIGKCTVQKILFLEYFWTNEDDDNGILQIVDLFVYESGFSLKLKNNNNYIDLKWIDKDANHKDLMRHACIGIEYLNDQRNKFVGYENQHDIHYNLMTSIIIGGSDTLIKCILFGDDVVKHTNLHIPRITRWTESKNNSNKSDLQTSTVRYDSNFPRKNTDLHNRTVLVWRIVPYRFSIYSLQIAIRLCKPGLERNRKILVVTYLLEYYLKNATEHHGWLITISKAIPDLYSYNLEFCIPEIFYKKCMEGIEVSDIPVHKDIIKNFNIAKYKFIAFNSISKPISTSELQFNFKALGKVLKLILEISYKIFLYTNHKFPSTVKIVPLHNFTVDNSLTFETNNFETSYLQLIIKLLKLIFIPRGYYRHAQSSPFVDIIRNESNNDIFNNPVMEAVIDYKWKPARNYLLQLFVLYILFAACFAAICGTYLLVVEYRQFHHHGWKYYFNLFNCVDLASIIVAVIVMSVYVTPSFDTKKAFANVITTQEITIAISFTMLLLWFEFILYLRGLFLLEPAKYIYIMLNIINETWVFLAFMLLVMAGFAHSFLLLLQYPDFTNLTEETSSSTLITGDSNFKIQNDFDRIEDNPAKNFITSFLSTYNWLNGVYLQDDVWNLWAVTFITFFGSFFLVTILQNMFIVFMGGVYSNAYEKGRVTLLRFRAEIISDYEALDKIYFYPPPPEPKYIYYV